MAMTSKYPSQIEKILQEKEIIQTIYKRVHQKLMNLDLSRDHTVSPIWVLENLDFTRYFKNLTEEQAKIVMSFRDIYIGVYFAAGILEADEFAMQVINSK